MVDQSILCPNDGVEVKVEVGSNRSFNRLDLAECADCQVALASSGILSSLGNVEWGAIDSIDIKTIVSCIKC